ncbi:MAG: YdeI/OmpD-associated family protein [Deltaproteobacteria bacterium]|nr:YdeI/OmpD-associated family protein [Nannocystaceae bacterium]
MPSVVPDPRRIKAFASEAEFERWLAAHHDGWPELWMRIYKKDSGVPSITALQAVDVVLCWGWIDAVCKGLDEISFLQRYVPRGPKSRWSQINRDNVARLTAAGRMTPHGQREVDNAKADGRWEAAYAPMRGMTADSLPTDLRAAIAADRRASKHFATIPKADLYALSFRLAGLKTPAGRAKAIASLVEKLARGEPLAAQRPAAPAKAASRAKKTAAKR